MWVAKRDRSACLVSALALALACVAGAADAQEEPDGEQAQGPDAAMMEAFMKAAKPGPQHEWLASLAGSWEFTAKFYQDPSQPPVESMGTAERNVMLDGRVVAEKVKGSFMDMPFEGFGLTGYDNVSGEFWGTWTDSMSTGVMVSSGECDDQGTCTFTGQYNDPTTGQPKTSKMLSHHQGDAEHHEFWEPGPDGREIKTMELEYRRKK